MQDNHTRTLLPHVIVELCTVSISLNNQSMASIIENLLCHNRMEVWNELILIP